MAEAADRPPLPQQWEQWNTCGKVGDEVRMRDTGKGEWLRGVVKEIIDGRPKMRQRALEDGEAFFYDEVERLQPGQLAEQLRIAGVLRAAGYPEGHLKKLAAIRVKSPYKPESIAGEYHLLANKIHDRPAWQHASSSITLCFTSKKAWLIGTKDAVVEDRGWISSEYEEEDQLEKVTLWKCASGPKDQPWEHNGDVTVCLAYPLAEVLAPATLLAEEQRRACAAEVRAAELAEEQADADTTDLTRDLAVLRRVGGPEADSARMLKQLAALSAEAAVDRARVAFYDAQATARVAMADEESANRAVAVGEESQSQTQMALSMLLGAVEAAEANERREIDEHATAIYAQLRREHAEWQRREGELRAEAAAVGLPDVAAWRASVTGRAPPAEVPMEMVRRQTNGWAAEQQVGRGGSSTVYEMYDMFSGKRLAAKRIAAGDAAAAGAFARELAVLTRPDRQHPSIAPLCGHARGDGYLCLLTPLAPRGSLAAALLDEAPARGLTWRRRARVATAVARGLAHLHQMHIFHRDVTSTNIVLDQAWSAQLIDYGVARILTQEEVEQGGTRFATTRATVPGTRGYQCPTYASDARGRYGAKSESYSFGIVLIELLVGQLAAVVPCPAAAAEDDDPCLRKRFLGEGLVYDERDDPEDILEHLDPRAGDWPGDVSRELVALVKELTCRYRGRMEQFSAGVRRLNAVERAHCAVTPEEEQLAAEVLADAPAGPAAELGECRICGDDKAVLRDGLLCPAGAHFLCRGCVVDRITAFVSLSVGEQAELGGVAPCPFHIGNGCERDAFDDQQLAMRLPKAAYDGYVDVRVRVREAAIAREMEETKRREVLAEVERRMVQGAVARHAHHILEKILTLRCPKEGCGAAFADFDACLALECAACRVYFCGVCLRIAFVRGHAGWQECHRHVALCPEHPQIVAGQPHGELFMPGGEVEWVAFQNRRRGRLIAQYMNTQVDAQHRGGVLDAVRPHCDGIPAGWDAVEEP